MTADTGMNKINQDVAGWHKARAKVVGGSEVAALYGCQPDYAMSHYTLWMVKSGRMDPPPVAGERPTWGILLEEAIAAAVSDKMGWHVYRPQHMHVVNPRCERMGCTLDFYADKEDEPDPLGSGLVECKNADWLAHKRTWQSEPPIHIQLQLQHQLACTGLKWGVVACLVGGNHLEVYEFEARPKIIADLQARVTAFWQSIRDGKEPPVDGSDSTAGALKAMFGTPQDEETDLTADNELPELCGDLLHITARRLEIQKDEQAHKNAIMAKLGNNARAKAQGFYINAPLINRKGFTVEPTTYRSLTVKEIT
jgi:predicted phage-related endonuclease